ncbi:hypothetical protein MMC32_007249 [Xylographa parallela]|nr:hypothetical protein [Xylographa parallela]
MSQFVSGPEAEEYAELAQPLRALMKLETSDFYIGKRISLAGDLGTVRYVGNVVGTQHDWLGIEWDDPTRGKHDGVYNGHVYFKCLNPQPMAASFIRSTRKFDQPVGFMEAAHKKYAPALLDPDYLLGMLLEPEEPISISGKVVEEIGFDKIAERQAMLDELQIAILDHACIAGYGPKPWWSPYGLELLDKDFNRKDSITRFGKDLLKLQFLDLGQNLLELWTDVTAICEGLNLKMLRLNGNRFRSLEVPSWQAATLDNVYGDVEELYLEDTLLTWYQVLFLLSHFHHLQTLCLASNLLNDIPKSLPTTNLTSLDLSYNCFQCIGCLHHLTALLSLEKLVLRWNQIDRLTCNTLWPVSTCKRLANPTNCSTFTEPMVFKSLLHLDVSDNLISSFHFISHLPALVPKLISLRISHNPLFATLSSDDSFMLTLARMGSIQILNYSNVTAAERLNAELYYLTHIGAKLSEFPVEEAAEVLTYHPRFVELCNLHGAPTVTRKGAFVSNVLDNTLGSRLITFTFSFKSYRSPEHGDLLDGREEIIKTIRLPRTINTYYLKSEVGRLFSIQPMHLRLTWETGEWDPVGLSLGPEDDEYWSVGSQSSNYNEEGECSGDFDSYAVGGVFVEEEREDEGRGFGEDGGEEAEQAAMVDEEREREKGKWVRREVELVDGTREVGHWIEGMEAKVRVEYRENVY